MLHIPPEMGSSLNLGRPMNLDSPMNLGRSMNLGSSLILARPMNLDSSLNLGRSMNLGSPINLGSSMNPFLPWQCLMPQIWPDAWQVPAPHRAHSYHSPGGFSTVTSQGAFPPLDSHRTLPCHSASAPGSLSPLPRALGRFSAAFLSLLHLKCLPEFKLLLLFLISFALLPHNRGIWNILITVMVHFLLKQGYVLAAPWGASSTRWVRQNLSWSCLDKEAACTWLLPQEKKMNFFPVSSYFMFAFFLFYTYGWQKSKILI